MTVYAIENQKEDVIPFNDQALLLNFFSASSASVNPTMNMSRGRNITCFGATADYSSTQPKNACFGDTISSTGSSGGTCRHSGSLHLSDYEILDCQPSMDHGNPSVFDIGTLFPGFDEQIASHY